MEIKQLENCNIVIQEDSGEIKNILPFAFVSKYFIEENSILISSKSNEEDERAGIILKASEVTKVKNTVFSGNVDELLQLISTEISLTGDCCGCSGSHDDEPVTIAPIITPIDDIELRLEKVEGIETISYKINLEITDPDSTEFTTGWKLISGPVTSIENDSDFTFTEIGVYLYEVKVTDESGNSDTEHVEFTILPYVLKSISFVTTSKASDFSFYTVLGLPNLLAEEVIVNYTIKGIKKSIPFSLISGSTQPIIVDLSDNVAAEDVLLVIDNMENLQTFDARDSLIKEVDLSMADNLQSINLMNNELTDFNISSKNSLKTLTLTNNNISDLDLNSNINLITVRAGGNQLSSINILDLVLLQTLDLEYNNLTSIDLPLSYGLAYLNLRFNQLNSVDISFYENLINFNCDSNNLTTLSVIDNLLLEIFTCSSNNLTVLDVTKKTFLKTLFFDQNKISQINLSQNTFLERLSFRENNLTAIDLTNNINLTTLFCQSNSISVLDLSNNPALVICECEVNNLINLNLKNSNSISIRNLSFYGNPDLKCIQVDDVGAAYNASVLVDALAFSVSHGGNSGIYYATSCPIN